MCGRVDPVPIEKLPGKLRYIISISFESMFLNFTIWNKQCLVKTKVRLLADISVKYVPGIRCHTQNL